MAEESLVETTTNTNISSESEDVSELSLFDDDLGDDGFEDIEDIVIDKTGPLEWIHSQISNNANPRNILNQLVPGLSVPGHVDDISLWRLVLEILSEPAPRQQLKHVNSLDHVKTLLSTCKNIVVLTGAGVSVSCGIPDFRSRDGIYARLSKDFPDLPDPQAMFDIQYFRSNQRPFFKFAKEIYPGQFTPSLCHKFISFLDRTGRLLRNYSQNIDTLEQVAGIKNVVQCHGSFATATCMNCKHKVQCEEIKEDIFNQKIPYCKKCTINNDENNVGAMNVIKPDIIFFGESLPQAFHRQIQEDKNKADLLIVIGSSLKVRPVSLIPNLIRPDVPQILINREPLSHLDFDVELYGNCDDVIAEICNQLGSDWTNILDGFKPGPLDKEKLEVFFEYNCYKTNEENSSDANESENLQQQTENENFVNQDSGIEYSSESSNESTSKQTSEDQLNNCFCNEEIGNKRKCECPSSDNGPSPNKRNKKEWKIIQDLKNSNEEVFYLSLPPNRYLFHGAELNLRSDDDSDDSDSESELLRDGGDNGSAFLRNDRDNESALKRDDGDMESELIRDNGDCTLIAGKPGNLVNGDVGDKSEQHLPVQCNNEIGIDKNDS